MPSTSFPQIQRRTLSQTFVMIRNSINLIADAQTQPTMRYDGSLSHNTNNIIAALRDRINLLAGVLAVATYTGPVKGNTTQVLENLVAKTNQLITAQNAIVNP